MATPVGHGLVGFLLHAVSARPGEPLVRSWRAAALVAAAMLPDVDLLARLVDGRNHHQMETHSLGAAVAAGLIAFGVLRVVGRTDSLARARAQARAGAWRSSMLFSLAWLSHGVVDFLSGDRTPPLGPMLLWPLSREHFIASHPLFLDTVRSLAWPSLAHNVRALGGELLILLPLLGLVFWLRPRPGPAIDARERGSGDTSPPSTGA